MTKSLTPNFPQQSFLETSLVLSGVDNDDTTLQDKAPPPAPFIVTANPVKPVSISLASSEIVLVDDPREIELENLKKRNAERRGMINGVSYFVSASGVLMLVLPTIIESLKSLTAGISSHTSVLEENPEAFLPLAILVSVLIVAQGLRTAYNYRNTDIENSETEKLLRDRRTALDGAVSVAGISYVLAYNITKAVVADPTSIIPCIVAGVVALTVGIGCFLVNDIERDYFTSNANVKKETSAATRILLARLWGFINALSYAGNVLMVISLAFIAAKSLIAFSSGTALLSILPLTGVGLAVGFGIWLIAMGIFSYRGIQIYGDIEKKKIILEEKMAIVASLEEQGDCKSETYQNAIKERDQAKSEFETAKNVEAKFRQHRLVVGAALTTFTMIMSLGLGLAAVTSFIPPLAIAITIFTIATATIAACYVTAKGIEAYEEPKLSAKPDTRDDTLHLYKATTSLFSPLRLSTTDAPSPATTLKLSPG